MNRPLVIIFLTIFVNLVGFGIIIPLLPFYATTFGATFALFVASRFRFDAAETGYLFAGFGLLGVIVQGGFIRPLVPLALGMGLGTPMVSSLVSHAAGKHEQGRMQGAASSVESLGRTVGPVWGTAALQHVGDSMPYISAAAFLLLTLAVSIGYRSPEPGVVSV